MKGDIINVEAHHEKVANEIIAHLFQIILKKELNISPVVFS